MVLSTAPGRNAARDFQKERIPGSIRFDIDAVADRSTGFPHMVAPPQVFAAAMDAASIQQDDLVVIYDRIGNFSSPRAWWTFKVFGHNRCPFGPEHLLCIQRGNALCSVDTSCMIHSLLTHQSWCELQYI
jgi:hypothetical protein